MNRTTAKFTNYIRVLVVSFLMIGMIACTAQSKEASPDSSAKTAAEPENTKEQAENTPDQTAAPTPEPQPTPAPEEPAVDPYISWDEVPENKFRKEELSVESTGHTLSGRAYVPETEQETYPLVIFSHGLGESKLGCATTAQLMAAHGIAAYIFDYPVNNEDRYTFSAMTQAEDLKNVIETAKNWSFVNPEEILLCGRSFGSVSVALAAAKNADEINGLILFYPALNIIEAVQDAFDDPDQIPDTFTVLGLTFGYPFAADILGCDIYDEIKVYAKPVLILQGDQDDSALIACAERAAEAYENAEYYVVEGAGHGFTGAPANEANAVILRYLQQIGVINRSASQNT